MFRDLWADLVDRVPDVAVAPPPAPVVAAPIMPPPFIPPVAHAARPRPLRGWRLGRMHSDMTKARIALSISKGIAASYANTNCDGFFGDQQEYGTGDIEVCVRVACENQH